MAFLSQASPLGSLLLPHDAFQEHAAPRAEWSAQLSSKGSERTCLRSGLMTFLHCTFTAHPACVVQDALTHRKPPEVRRCRLSIQSGAGTRPPSTSTPHGPACRARRCDGTRLYR